ncbi:MAG: hypothetical protein ABI779_04750 [Acidobacteriota bacterium]
MKWIKRGLIYKPDGTRNWARHGALQPTPFLFEEKIRVFVGLRDDDGVSSVGWVDLATDDPSRILGISEQPALTAGDSGMFDENGVVPCSVVRIGSELWMSYAGYQLGHKVRFTVFGGLAVSGDGGHTFQRLSRVPFLDRADEACLFRVAHTLMFEDGRWRVWYGAGSDFRAGSSKSVPVYDIRYFETTRLTDIPKMGRIVVPLAAGENRVARPWVVRRPDGRYSMFYGFETASTSYRLGHAESSDGITWTRRDEEFGLGVSEEGAWDCEMISYPSVVSAAGRTVLFYNGNDYGRSGFGWAELESW